MQNDNSKQKPLILGIKRGQFRSVDKDSKKADQTFRAVRNKVLEAQDYRCYRCGYQSKSNEVHHLDDDHHNNALENLKVACKLCHPYSHIGEAARPVRTLAEQAGRVPSKAAALIRVPKELKDVIRAEDLNHLMRVIGVALTDKSEAAHAKRLYAMLTDSEQMREFARALYGEESGINSVLPSDVAAAMSHLTDDEYNKRYEYIDDVRVLYAPQYLMSLAQGIKKQAPTIAEPAHWRVALQGVIDDIKSRLQQAPIYNIDAYKEEESSVNDLTGVRVEMSDEAEADIDE